MSYCRWSSDDFGCDLYCYGSDRGYETHVASRRPIGEVPKSLPFPSDDAPKEAWDAFAASHQAQLDWLSTCERESIGGPFDGASFCDSTAEEWLVTLTMLRDAGYHFPDYVLDDAREEIAEAAATASRTANPSEHLSAQNRGEEA